jgi:SAM-dependent methyltransferase
VEPVWKRLLRPVVDRLSRRLDSQVIANPWVHGTLIPIRPEGARSVFLHSGAAASDTQSGELPVPPVDLLAGYTEQEYLRTGARDVETMLEVLREAGASPEDLTAVLEFGSGSARMTRSYPRGPESEIWGVDIFAEQVLWCQDHLAPLRFATVTTAPHLPFEDGYFDLVYCGSVFTHIRELADAWLLELRRVVRKGGYMYVTIHDKHTAELLLANSRPFPDVPWHEDFVKEMKRLDRKTSIRTTDWDVVWDGHDPYSQVFYDLDYLVRKWSAFCDVVATRKEAYQYQTALVLQK